MLSHAILQFYPDFVTLRPITRTATPAFVILFGIMLELAYMQKIRTGGDATAVDRRLLSRMVLCFMLFVGITFAATATGKLGLCEGLLSILFLSSGRFGVILKIYTVLFLLVILLRPWLVKYGTDLLIAAAAGAWILREGANALTMAWGLDIYVLSFLFGSGQGFGPAILPSLTFLAFGVAMGEMITGRSGRTRAAGILILALILVVLEIARTGFGGMVTEFLVARWRNLPLYFAVGIVTTAAYLAIAAWIWRRGQAGPVLRGLADLGRQTLMIYAGGNLALNLLPIYRGDPVTSVLLIVVFMTGLLATGLYRARRPKSFDRCFAGFPGHVERGVSTVVDRCVVPLHRGLALVSGRSRSD